MRVVNMCLLFSFCGKGDEKNKSLPNYFHKIFCDVKSRTTFLVGFVCHHGTVFPHLFSVTLITIAKSMKTLYAMAILLLACGSGDTLTIKSSAFGANEMIPSKYTCTGENINPELSITGIPSGAESLALIMDDPDAPNGDFVHWVMWNIPVQNEIAENSAPGVQGTNGRGDVGYTGPCPPSGTHHYHFKVYALDANLDLPASTDKQRLLKAMEGHILEKGELIGLFKK